MTAKKKLQSPALRFTYDRTIKGKPEREASFEAELANAEVARKLYDLRTKAGLSQRALARLVGTTASVICRYNTTRRAGCCNDVLSIRQAE